MSSRDRSSPKKAPTFIHEVVSDNMRERGVGGYVRVVAPMAVADADRHFRQWLDDRRIPPAMLADGCVRIDVIRVTDGRNLRRYRVCKSAIDRLAGRDEGAASLPAPVSIP